MRLDKYREREGTPLAFHGFFRYFLLPLRALSAVGQVVYLFDPKGQGDIRWFWVLSLLYFALSALLSAACFVGCFGWKKWAYVGIMAYLAVAPIYTLAQMVAELGSPDALAAAGGQFGGALLFSVLAGVYYFRRSPLFNG